MGLDSSTDFRKLLYKVLQHSLIEIRSSTEETAPERKIYAISSLVHNLPIILMEEDHSENPGYQKIYSEILSRADSLGIGTWVRSINL